MALDPTEGMIAQARVRFADDPGVHVQVASARALPLDWFGRRHIFGRLSPLLVIEVRQLR